MTDQVHLWSGLYATDALDPDERARFEAHLATCADCRAEVAGFHETLADLAIAGAEAPPASSRAEVLVSVAATRQVPPTGAPVTALDDRRRHTATWVLAAAACLLVVLGAVVALTSPDRRASDAEQIAAIVAADDARTIRLEGDGRGPVTLVWSAGRGEAALVGDGVERIDATKAYELWAIRDGTPERVTLFRPTRRGAVRTRFPADLDGADAVGVTLEPAGGSEAPTSPIIWQSTVS